MSKASLPPDEYTPPGRIVDPVNPLRVTVIAEGGAETFVFDFGALPVSVELQTVLADGFVRITGPGGTRRTIPSARSAFNQIRMFARNLGESDPVPTRLSELAPSHVDSMRLRSTASWSGTAATLRAVFLKTVTAPDPFMRKLMRPAHKLAAADPVDSYSREHFRLVMDAARQTVRSADERIRRNRLLVADYRRGVVQDEGSIQKEIAYRSLLLETGDLPRDGDGNVARRGLPRGFRPSDLMRDLHPTLEESAALAILLVGLTGQNLAQVLTLPAAHHRADAQTDGETPTALVRASKPRRGPTKSEMTVPLTGIPTWIVAEDEARLRIEDKGRPDLHSAFGVYVTALRLGLDARTFADSERLLMFYSARKLGVADFGGFRSPNDATVYAWSLSVDIRDREGERVQPDTRRLRRTFIEQKQKPVAQSHATFVDTYLARDRGNIEEYQKVVSRVLDAEVDRAKQAVAQVLSAENVMLAQSDLQRAAIIAKTDPETLTRALAGELDTVMNSCVDHEHSPYSPPGSPCGASFMLCLGCPNARAEPRHLPVQLLVLAAIEARRDEMEAIAWATRFAVPHARLLDLFAQFPMDTVDAARGRETEADKALVRRFLGRELDVK